MGYQDIEPAALATIAALPGLTVIDQRDAATRRNGELPGAVAPDDTLIARLVRQRRNDPAVLVYCYRGNQSRELCAFLAQLGLQRVYNLAGGWDALEKWRAGQTASGEAHDDWLRERGFDPDDLNARVEMGMSALMQASLEGDLALVQALLQRGANPNHINDDGHHALWFACVNGNVALVERLTEAGANLNNRNVNGVTSAVYAASTGKLAVLQTLVAAGADLSLRTDDGYDALDSATTLDVLRYLRRLHKASVQA